MFKKYIMPKHHTREEKNFIIENWQKMTDFEMSEKLELKQETVSKIRLSLNLVRPKNRTINDRLLISGVLEMYIGMDFSIKKISSITGKKNATISNLISKHFFTKKHNDNTETLILKSKV